MELYCTGLHDGYFPDPESTDEIDLRTGAPATSQLRRVAKIFRASVLQHAGLERADRLFQYGHTRGPPRFVHRLAEFLTAGYASNLRPVAANGLMATAGATSGLWLAATVLLAPGAVVFVESPTYFIALSILKRDLGHRIVPVPMQEDGVDLIELQKRVNAEKKIGSVEVDGQKRFWAMFYTVPTFHNPMGVTLSPAKSSRLVELARDLDLLVLCDDVYNLLWSDGGSSAPERLLAYDSGPRDGLGHVVSNGSFSKLLGPGLRLGWLEGNPGLINRLADGTGLLRSSCGMNNVAAGIVAAAIEDGLVCSHVEHLREEYALRFDAVHKVLQQLTT